MAEKAPRLTDKKTGELKPLTAVQKRKMIAFADLYRGGPNEVREVAWRCYKELHPRAKQSTCQTHGSEWLNHPFVQGYLANKAEEITKDADVTQEYVITKIKDTVERCSQARPVMRYGEHVMVETEDGEVAPAYTFDASNVLKGCELLGRNLKMFTDKVEASVTDGKSLAELAQQARDESQ